MTYIVCTKKKSAPHKAIAVCERCKYHKKCKDYQNYLKKEEKKIMVSENNKNIPMFPVDSKNIRSLGYNANTRTLRIEFKQGAYYDYGNIPPEVFQSMMAAESKGKFFHQHIRNKFEFSKLVEENEKKGG